MRATSKPDLPEGDGINYSHQISETTLVDVLMDGQFKVVVFYSLDGEYYIAIGDTTPYHRKMFLNGGIDGLVAIRTNEKWFSVTKNEGNNLYKKLKASEQTSKKGNIYYIW